MMMRSGTSHNSRVIFDDRIGADGLEELYQERLKQIRGDLS